MKSKTATIFVLAMLAGLLSAVAFATHEARAAAGSVHGGVYWIDQYGNAHLMAWAQITADDGISPPVVAYTTDGSYMMWLPVGTYNITASSDLGFYPESAAPVVVSPGSSTSIDFTLKPTGQPIPELPPWAQPLIISCLVLITVTAVRRHRTRTRSDRT